MGDDWAVLTQVRKCIIYIIIVEHARTSESSEISGSKSCGGNRQRNRLIKPLLTGETYTALRGLMRMFITKASPTFDTLTKRRMLATMRNKITYNHFTLIGHSTPRL